MAQLVNAQKPHTLYMILSEQTHKVYIGQTTSVSRRLGKHLNLAKTGKGYAIHSAMRKYGIDTFDLVPLDTFATKAEVDAAEIRWIAHYKALNRSYNITPGGDGCGAGEQHPMYGITGENHPLYGKPLSAEHRAKMSKSRTGKYTGEDNHNYGKPKSEETRAKISATKAGKCGGANHPMYGRTGENNPLYGKPRSDETKAKLSLANTKYPPTLIASFPNRKAATEATGISAAQYNRIRKKHPDLNWPPK